MVYLLGYNIIESRLVKRALESFYGVGPSISVRIMAKFHIHPLAKVGSLKPQQINDLQQHLSGMTIENDLRRKLIENITRLRDMGSYRGRRHAMGLPARGQRTRSQIGTARKLNKIERKG